MRDEENYESSDLLKGSLASSIQIPQILQSPLPCAAKRQLLTEIFLIK